MGPLHPVTGPVGWGGGSPCKGCESRVWNVQIVPPSPAKTQNTA